MSLLPLDLSKIPPLQSSLFLISPKTLSLVLEPVCLFLFADLFPTNASFISYSTFESFCKDSQHLIPSYHCNCHFFNQSNESSSNCCSCVSIKEVFSKLSSNSLMSFSQFLNFLLSPTFNPPFLLSLASHRIDTSLPLSQYYISSSHNTYLIGSQVLGTSSTLYYRNVLLKNCRCLEIDIWDLDDKPVVSHGPTLTSPVQLIDVLRTIKQYGFVTTDLPLILSIEIHCCEDYQIQVKDLFIQELGDSLFFMPFNDDKLDLNDKQLSLRHFLNTIIIKMKRPHLLAIGNASSSSSLSLLASPPDPRNFYKQQEALSPDLLQRILYDEYDESILNSSSPTAKKLFSAFDDRASLSSSNSMDSTTRIHSYTSTITSTSTLNSFEEFNNGHNDHQQHNNSLFSNPSNSLLPSPTKFHIIPELYELSSYIYGLKFHSFDEITSIASASEINGMHVNNHCFSFSNKRFKSIVPKLKFQIHKHNKTHLMRIYPASYKVTSKNFNAVPFWKFGCQMVATNWQTYDIDQQMNEAMFIRGFARKPDYLLSNSCDGSNKHSQNSYIDKNYFDDVDVEFQFLVLFNDYNSEENRNGVSFDANFNSDSVSNNFNVSLQIIDKEAKIFATKLQHASTVMTTISQVFKKKKPIFKTTNPLVISNSDHLCVVYNSKISARIEKTLKDFIFLKFSINKTISAVVRLVYLNKGYRVLQLRNDRTGELTTYKLLVKINY